MKTPTQQQQQQQSDAAGRSAHFQSVPVGGGAGKVGGASSCRPINKLRERWFRRASRDGIIRTKYGAAAAAATFGDVAAAVKRNVINERRETFE